MRRYNQVSASHFKFFVSNIKKKILKFKSTKWKKTIKKMNTIIKFFFKKYKQKKIIYFKFYATKKKYILLKYFNKPKKNYKYFIKRKKKLLKLFLNFNINKNICKFHYPSRRRFFFKEKLFIKKNFNTFFDGGFNWSFYKKILLRSRNKTYLTNKFFIHPEYRVDIILWRTFFFNNIYEVEKAIQGGQILLNNKKLYLKYYVKEGDILKVLKPISFFKHSNSFFISKIIFSHLQIDYYCGLIIILQNWHEYNPNNWKSIINLPLSLSKIKHLFLV